MTYKFVNAREIIFQTRNEQYFNTSASNFSQSMSQSAHHLTNNHGENSTIENIAQPNQT